VYLRSSVSGQPVQVLQGPGWGSTVLTISAIPG
jgi:hypothetical protein